MARHFKRFQLLATLATSTLTAAPAAAYEEQASVDAALGYALVVGSDSLPNHGATLDLGAGLGLGDVALLRGSLGYALLNDATSPAAHAGRARVEALYLLDVLQVVPFFGLGASLLVSEGTRDRVTARPGAHIALGIDYLVSRSWLLGLDVRSGLLIERGTVRSTTDAGLRVSRMFELF